MLLSSLYTTCIRSCSPLGPPHRPQPRCAFANNIAPNISILTSQPRCNRCLTQVLPIFTMATCGVFMREHECGARSRTSGWSCSATAKLPPGQCHLFIGTGEQPHTYSADLEWAALELKPIIAINPKHRHPSSLICQLRPRKNIIKIDKIAPACIYAHCNLTEGLDESS